MCLQTKFASLRVVLNKLESVKFLINGRSDLAKRSKDFFFYLVETNWKKLDIFLSFAFSNKTA